MQYCLHVTHFYLINFVKGFFLLVSEAHCGCTSLHEYLIMITTVFELGES